MRIQVPGHPGPPPKRPEITELPALPSCEHPSTEVRRFRQSNGVLVARVQCLTCGSGLSNVRKDSVSGFDSLREFDEALRDRWRERMNRAYEERRALFTRDHDAEWWSWYDAYLRSPAWSRLREQVLARDGHLCQGCRESRATQAHHLTYERVGAELLFDLIALCDRCHERCHPHKGS